MGKTKAQDNTSPKENEKLKKRLQTLFKHEEKSSKGFAGSNKIDQKSRNSQEQQQVNGQQLKTKYVGNPSKLQKSGNLQKSQKNKNMPKTPNQKASTQNVSHGGSSNPKQKNTPNTSQNASQTSEKLKNPKQKNKKLQNPQKIVETPQQKKNNYQKTPISETSQQTQKSKQSNKKKNKNVQPAKISNPIAPNDQQKLSKNQKRKAKKRAAAEPISNHQMNSKKPKFNKNKNGNKSKIFQQQDYISQKQHKTPINENYEYNMPGFVQGGDFDAGFEDYMHHQNWMQNENYYGNSNESIESNFDSDEETTMHNGNDMVHVSQGNANFDSSEDDYFDSDEYDDDFSDSEEYENYSDFDENDYEEDEDSYNYSMDSDDDVYFASEDEDYNGEQNYMSYNFEHDDNDEDYNLPEHVPEDLIIHRGTATKRDIIPEDNISFNSDNEETQIIELAEQQVVKVIKQPKAYDREELLKLKCEVKTITTITEKKSKSPTIEKTTDSNDCPKLVPIVDEDGFQLYNFNEDEEQELYENDSMEESYEDDSMEDVSLGSEYVEINSEDGDSLLSEDINEKYLNRNQDDDSDSSVNDSVWIKQQKVDIIDATSCKYVDKKKDAHKDDSEGSSDSVKQLPSQQLYKHVDVNTTGSILSTTIIDEQEDLEIQNFKEVEVYRNEDIENTTNAKSNTEQNKIIEIDSLNTSPINVISENSTKQIVNRVKTTNQNVANYNTKFFNALDSNLVLVLLKDPFYIYGTVRLTLLAGVLDVYGHSLSVNKEVEIFSPRGCSVIEIAPTPTTNEIISKDNLKELLKNYDTNFALADLKTICDSYDGEKDAIVLLQRNEGRKKIVQQFKKFMNENVFPNINNINIDRPLYNSESLLRCMINTSAQEHKCLQLPKQWHQLSVTQQSRVMLTGGKAVGKSTLLRYLINRHLQKLQQILLIDLDIGQPEIFVPQTVSCCVIKQPLLGPGFLLNIQAEKSYAVGHTNIALCAHKYLEAVRSLISHCSSQEQYSNMPWLINTMGYNKGFGLELISVIAKELHLTDVIQLQSCKDINNFDSILFPHVVSNVPRNMFVEESISNDGDDATNKLDYRLHAWQSAVQQESRYQKDWDMSAKDLRYATLLARLSEALQGHAEWLTDCKPLCAPLDQLKLINLMENTAAVSQEELAKALEANLVYLCNYEDSSKPVECLGIGVVRGIDFHVQQLYLLPAMAPALLKHVNCLAIGEMPLPTSLYTNQGSKVKNLAPFVYDTVADKASKAIKQIYHRPHVFLSGKHKPLE